jgi:hypothetical protein
MLSLTVHTVSLEGSIHQSCLLSRTVEDCHLSPRIYGTWIGPMRSVLLLCTMRCFNLASGHLRDYHLPEGSEYNQATVVIQPIRITSEDFDKAYFDSRQGVRCVRGTSSSENVSSHDSAGIITVQGWLALPTPRSIAGLTAAHRLTLSAELLAKGI